MFYIFNASNTCVGCCDKQPDADDLKTRSETAVESDTIYDISSIVLINGTVTQKPAVVLTADEIKANKIATLDAEYQPKFTAVTQAYLTAITAGDAVTATARQTDYAALKTEYSAALEAIS